MNPYKILDIKKDATIEEINRAFKKLAKKYHPDTSKKQSKKFLQLVEARDETLKRRKSLIKVESNLVRKEFEPLIREIIKTQPKKDFETRKRELVSLKRSKFRKNSNPIKFTSTSILAVLTFLYVLPDRLLALPFYGTTFISISENRIFGMMWFMVLSYTALIWFFIWIQEKKYLRMISEFMEKNNLERVYRNTKSRFKRTKFSKTQFIRTISGIKDVYIDHWSILSFYLLKTRRNILDEDVANTVLDEFLSKGIIEPVQVKDLDDWYRIS